MQHPAPFDAVTVTLNPAIDRTLTIPRFAVGEVHRVEEDRSFPGGKGVNVAAALADAGCAVAALGFLGRDNAAEFESLFAGKGITDGFIRIPGQTRVGIKIVDPAGQTTTDINFPGAAPGAMDMAMLCSRVTRTRAHWFVLAGSLPPGVGPEIYRELIPLIKSRGGKVALDTSGDALHAALSARPHIIKPNIRELEAMLGETLSSGEAVERAARQLLSEGLEMVVVSMGAEGALFVTAEEAVHAQPPKVEVRSAVGAGDAMVAGIVAAQVRGLAIKDCARMATAFSLDALTRLEPGISCAAAIEESMARVALN
jgi:1-phosphofructokinase